MHHALRRTAHVIGGAALIMTAVFVTFAQTDVINVRQFGVGLAIAVVLDATVVRLVLLPTVMLLLGDRAWPRRAGNRSASLPSPRPGSLPAPVPRTSAG